MSTKRRVYPQAPGVPVASTPSPTPTVPPSPVELTGPALHSIAAQAPPAHTATPTSLAPVSSLSQVPSNVQTPVGSSLPPPHHPYVQPCPHEFMTLTTSFVPQSPQLATHSALPFGLCLQPLRPSEPLPLADFGVSGIIRCSHCRAYVNPYVVFIEGGRRWRCNFCETPNEVPNSYYNAVDQMGTRVDLDQHPELVYGACEFIATPDYIRRAPQPPVYTFVIDVSSASVANGMLYIAVDVISKTLDHLLAINEMTRIALVTYDTSVHLYHFQPSSNNPTMMVLSDINEPEIPQGYPFLCPLKEVKKSIAHFLSGLPNMFTNTKNSHACLGSAAQAAFHLQKSLGGKMIIISSLPPVIGRGACNPSFDSKLLGTPKESQILSPNVAFYKTLGQECSKAQISVDMFCCSAGYHDIPSLSILPHMTGGQVKHYPQFSAQRDAMTLGSDIQTFLLTPRGWESVMRVRCSSGIEVQHFHGNLSTENDLIVFPVLDSNKGLALRLKIKENIDVAKKGNYVYFQAGLLYTSDTSERRVRVFTTCLPLTSNLAQFYNSANTPTMINLMAKVAAQHALKTRLSESREVLVNQLMSIMKNYKSLATLSAATQLALPDCLQSLPLYILALVKNVSLRSTFNVQPDERVTSIDFVRTMPMDIGDVFILPRLYALANMPPECGFPSTETGQIVLPPLEGLSIARLSGGVFLLDNGVRLILWISAHAPQDLLMELFGVPHIENIDTTQFTSWAHSEGIPADSLYNRLAAIIGQITLGRQQYQPFMVSREGDVTHATHFLPAMIEDRQINMHSYFEFIQQLQRTA